MDPPTPHPTQQFPTGKPQGPLTVLLRWTHVAQAVLEPYITVDDLELPTRQTPPGITDMSRFIRRWSRTQASGMLDKVYQLTYIPSHKFKAFSLPDVYLMWEVQCCHVTNEETEAELYGE